MVSRRRGRDLSEEDRELWSRVARTTRPLPRRAGKEPPASQQATPEKTAKSARPRPARSGTGDAPPASAAATGAPGPEPAPPQRIDRKRFEQLRRGRIRPEARIDLHGMTAARALPALTEFVLDAHARGLRLLLVITGKGTARHDEDGIIPRRRGLLRHSVPQWLSRPPLGSMILHVQPAHHRHGGAGAYYVYLRRARR